MTEEKKFHPFAGRDYRTYGTFELQDPIPSQITDPDQLSKFFDRFRIIPYASVNVSTGDSLRNLRKRMMDFSPTHAGCINGKNDAAFQGDIELYRNNNFLRTGKVSDSDVSSYAEQFNKIDFHDGVGYNDFLDVIGRSYQGLGECFVKVHMKLVQGEYQLSFSVMPHEFSYVALDANNKPFYLWCPQVLTYKLDNHETYPFYPTFQKEKLGWSSILHIKNGLGFYGVPSSSSSILEQYLELQLPTYLVKQSANNFVGQVFIETEGEETGKGMVIDDQLKREGIKNLATQFMQNFTAGGRNQTVMVTERPFGTKQALVHQFQPQTNEAFYITMLELTRQEIVVSHGWSERLLGISKSDALGGEAEKSDYLKKMATVVPKLRYAILSPIDKVIQQWLKLNRYDSIADINQNITNPLYAMYMKEMEKTTNDNTAL